ncbi:hypothetical protein CSAL01_09033 [Colletotrichum salicis]|uniref:Heterokaryon incompatibility domain-containing protein n=1 Tax=Colletotrichum salicis TaxID=1209931 RepID=A0A135UT28_9PEZI|nr:hypothetical protein CSAL01_09033 [Colletotrichum salicis]
MLNLAQRSRKFFMEPIPDTTEPRVVSQDARTLWVDAICINQMDNVEKGHQVGTMDLVYRSQDLVVWLGESSEKSSIALDLIQLFEAALDADTLFGKNNKAWDTLLRSQTDETWAAFMDLIKRPWFTRRWVVREVDTEFSFSINHLSTWIPWYGLQTIIFEPDHSHQLHGYNTRSLTTFGQPLSMVRIGQAGYYPEVSSDGNSSSCKDRICDGCDRYMYVHGTGYRCDNCEDFDFGYKCIGTASIDHNPTHLFKINNNAVYFASGYSNYVLEGDPLRCGCSSSYNCLRFPFGGFFVDTIESIGPGGTVWRYFGNSEASMPFAQWKRLQGVIEFGLDKEGNFNTVFLRTTVGNRLLSKRGVTYLPDEYLKILHRRFNEGQMPFEEPELLSSVEVMLSNDRKLATSTKSFGFVPSNTKVGDRIAILIGCSVPVVLRDVGNLHGMRVWQLVGECYIDGIMEGEFIDFADERKLEPEEIVLV